MKGKNMANKKILQPLLVYCLIIVVMSGAMIGCAGNKLKGSKINFITVAGAPILNVTRMWADGDNVADGYTVNYKHVGNPTLLVAELIQGNADFAIAPINIAAIMHNNGSGYRLAGVALWGINYIVAREDAAPISSIADLKGKTLIASSKAGTPGATLLELIKQNNMTAIETGTPTGNQVRIDWVAEVSNVQAQLVADNYNYAMLSEPVATALTLNQDLTRKLRISIDLQTEWEEKFSELYPQTGLIFHERLLSNHANFVKNFVEAVEVSSAWVLANPSEAGTLASSVPISVAALNADNISSAVAGGRLRMNVVRSQIAKQAVDNYLQILLNTNSSLIGGKKPGESFYYAIS